jgi:hypothetical protein
LAFSAPNCLKNFGFDVCTTAGLHAGRIPKFTESLHYGTRFPYKSKETKLTDDAAHLREHPRKPLLLDARCRKTSWLVNQVDLVDISEGGCCITGRMDGLAVGDEIALSIADLGGISGTVRWLEDKRAGIAFVEQLEADVVAFLVASYSDEDAGASIERNGLNAA